MTFRLVGHPEGKAAAISAIAVPSASAPAMALLSVGATPNTPNPAAIPVVSSAHVGPGPVVIETAAGPVTKLEVDTVMPEMVYWAGPVVDTVPMVTKIAEPSNAL